MVKRLRERGTESPERIERRLRTAREELPEAAHFDYIVENDDLAITLNTLHAITRAERQRALRMHDHLQRFLATIPPA
jgi:guanylate kinase